MTEGPPRYQSDPNLPFTSDEIRRLAAAHDVPPDDIAEKIVDAFLGPQEAETQVMCPICQGVGMVTPRVAAMYAKPPPIDSPELDEE